MSPPDPAPSLGRETAPEQPFERLLVPVDFSLGSHGSKFPVVAAMRIADRQGSEVVLFHAAGFAANETSLSALGPPWGRTVKELEEHLRQFADLVYPGSGGRVAVDATGEQDPVRAIVHAAERHRTTLAVLGADDRTHLRRSSAERIAHALSCAVLFAREA